MVFEALDGRGGRRTLAVLTLVAAAVAVGVLWQAGVIGGGTRLECGHLTEQQREQYENVYGEGAIPTRELSSFEGDVGDAVVRAIGEGSTTDTGPGVPVEASFERDPFFVETNGTVYRCATDA